MQKEYGEEMITPEGVEPEDMDKLGCQAYTMLVITEGYKKRMLDWQDSIRSHYGMPIIERDIDPEYFLKSQRKSLTEGLVNFKDVPEETYKKLERFAEMRDYGEFEAMSRFIARKRAQERT